MSAVSPTDIALDIKGLRLEAIEGGRTLVPSLDLQIRRGELVGLVGESGSGKTLTCFAIAGLLPSGVRMAGGEIVLDGQRIDNRSEKDWREIRGGKIGMIFQDPLSSFNPVKTIGSILIESARRHQNLSKVAARTLAVDILKSMHLPGTTACVDAYPHQLSGGQRQRAMIGLALINNPALLLADEPTTALDPTVQLQILALMRRKVSNSAGLMVTHDIAAAAAICDRLAVMLEGQIIEEGPTRALLSAPRHDFTRQLLAAAPIGTLAGGERQ